MADRPTIKTVSAGAQYDTDTLNENFIKLRDAFDNLVARQGTGGSNNTFDGDLDMGGHVIRNATSIDIVSGITETVNSISALRLLTLDNVVDTVIVKGNTTAGDGGGGVYIYDINDTTSPDNNGTIIVDAAGRRWKLVTADEITPEMFGAKGNDAVADTTAIRTALAALPVDGTLRLKDGRTYYCQVNASRLSPDWNTIPRVPVSDNSSFTVGEVITGGTSGTTMTVVGIDPGGSWIGGRDMVGSGFVNGEAITGDISGSSTATGNVDFGGGGLYDAHVAFELTKPVTIEGRGTLKLIGSDSTSKLPYVFGNSKDVPISGLRFRDFTIDLDATANINAGSGQPRGFFLVKCSDVEIAESVTITSSAGNNCYGGSFMDCHKVKVHPKITSVSGGMHWIYCSQLDIAPTMDGFNEAIDLDKPCYDVRLGGTYRNGQKVNGQIFDINACSVVVLDGVIARNSGIVAFYNGKKNIAANFDDHIAGINYAFRTGNDFTISDNCEFYECNYSAGSASLVIGNNWAGNPHPGVRPVGRIRIGGSWTKCGFMRVYEADGITFTARLEDILTPTGANPGGAVAADSEDDWSTYPDAEDWSDLKIEFAPGFQVIGCNRRAVDILSASEVTINGIKVRNPATFGNTSDRAVYIQNIDKRSTKGIIGGNDIDCNNACDGIGILGDGTGAPSITVLPNRIANWLNYPYRLSGTWQHGLKGQKWSQRLGKFAAADMPITDMPVLTADTNRGIIILQGWWSDEVGVAADPTDFVSLLLRRLSAAGVFEGIIFNATTSSTGFTALVPGDLGAADATYQIVTPGKTVSLRIGAGGAGVDVQGTLILQYLEWTE